MSLSGAAKVVAASAPKTGDMRLPPTMLRSLSIPLLPSGGAVRSAPLLLFRAQAAQSELQSRPNFLGEGGLRWGIPSLEQAFGKKAVKGIWGFGGGLPQGFLVIPSVEIRLKQKSKIHQEVDEDLVALGGLTRDDSLLDQVDEAEFVSMDGFLGGENDKSDSANDQDCWRVGKCSRKKGRKKQLIATRQSSRLRGYGGVTVEEMATKRKKQQNLEVSGFAWAMWTVRNRICIQKSFPERPIDVVYMGISFVQKWTLLMKPLEKGRIHDMVELVLRRAREFRPSPDAVSDVSETRTRTLNAVFLFFGVSCSG